MTWGLTKEFTCETQLSTEEAMTRLRTIVDTKNKFKTGIAAITNKIYKPYYGFVRETTFDFFNTPTQWPNSSIQIVGKFNALDGGSTNKITIKITPVNNLTPSLIGIAFSVIPIIGFLIMPNLEAMLETLLFSAIGFGIIYLPFQINYVETRNKLESLLRLMDIE